MIAAPSHMRAERRLAATAAAAAAVAAAAAAAAAAALQGASRVSPAGEVR